MYLNVHPLEVVSRYCNLQLQVRGNHSYLFNLRPNNLQFLAFKHIFHSH